MSKINKKLKVTKNKDGVYIFSNPDKENREQPTSDYAFIPSPSRVLIYALPDCGKTNLCLNLIKAQNFQRIIIFHNIPAEQTKEYEILDCEVYNDVLDQSEIGIDSNIKNLIIFEDFNFKTLNKDQKKNVIDYLTWVSSHMNTTIYILCQDIYHQLTTNIRRYCNVVILFKTNDVNNIRNICSDFGIDFPTYKYINNVILEDNHDSFIIDRTRKKEERYRKNLHTIVPLLK